MAPHALTVAELDEMQKRNTALVLEVVKVSLGIPGTAMLDPSGTWKQIVDGLTDTAKLAGEVRRLRDQLRSIRDLHSPQNSSDPNRPGAVCTACSLDGAWIAWPCTTWKVSEIPS